jgi:hypothetical protein
MAVKVAFPLGGMTLSGLRSEAKKGNLAIEVIAGKQFTTLKAIQEMREKCRAEAKAQGSGYSQPEKTGTERSSNKACGSSGKARSSAALDAARAKLTKLQENSGITSTPNPQTGTATVTHLPLSSRT